MIPAWVIMSKSNQRTFCIFEFEIAAYGGKATGRVAWHPWFSP
jgi:hypothetical protein